MGEGGGGGGGGTWQELFRVVPVVACVLHAHVRHPHQAALGQAKPPSQSDVRGGLPDLTYAHWGIMPQHLLRETVWIAMEGRGGGAEGVKHWSALHAGGSRQTKVGDGMSPRWIWFLVLFLVKMSVR